MGKSILIITLGMSLIIGFIILKLNTNSTFGTESTMNKFDQTHARLIANSGAEIFLEQLYQHKTLFDVKDHGPFNLMNGTYNINISGTYNNLILKSTSHFLGVNHTSIIETEIVPPPLPNVTSALYFTTSALSGVKNLGDAALKIDGKNYKMNENPGSNGNNLVINTSSLGVPGITVDNQADKDFLIKNFGSFLNSNVKGVVGGINVSGAAAVGVTGVNYNWQPLADYLISAAQGPPLNAEKNYSSATLGTLSSPKITFINEPTEATVKFTGTTTGAGILIINGNVQFNTLVFNGLIFCYRESNIEFTLGGNSTILGAIIVAGNSIEFKGKGNPGIYYSSEAIQNMSTNLAALGFRIKSWWE
jgi:hypothetical protein